MASTLLRLLPLLRPAYRLGKRIFRKKRRGGRRIQKRKTQNAVHHFVRHCDKDTEYVTSLGPNLITETGSDQHLTYQFKLDNLVNPSDFTNLYDFYRINKITLMLEPLWEQSGAGTGLNQNRRIRVVHDYSDATQLTQEDDYLEYANCKSYFPWSKRGIKITLYPKIKNAIENKDGTVNAFTSVNSNKVWLDTDNDEVPHFGLKIFIPGTMGGNGLQLFRVRAKFHISVKNSK